MLSLKVRFFLAFLFLVPIGLFLFLGFDSSMGAGEAIGPDGLPAEGVLTGNNGEYPETVAGNQVVPGISVGGLLIPSSLNKKGIEFIELLQSKGNFPIVVEPGMVGKENIFKK